MATDKIQLQSQGIKRVLKRYKLYDAAAEYIWNSFDAQATKTEVIFERNVLGAIEKITVRDNGYGIDMEELPEKFRPIFREFDTYKSFQQANNAIPMRFSQNFFVKF